MKDRSLGKEFDISSMFLLQWEMSFKWILLSQRTVFSFYLLLFTSNRTVLNSLLLNVTIRAKRFNIQNTLFFSDSSDASQNVQRPDGKCFIHMDTLALSATHKPRWNKAKYAWMSPCLAQHSGTWRLYATLILQERQSHLMHFKKSGKFFTRFCTPFTSTQALLSSSTCF